LRCRPGDLWCLGERRNLCGDARSRDDTGCVIGEHTFFALFTDHPYYLWVKNDIAVGAGRFAELAEGPGEMSDLDYEDFLRVTIGDLAQALKFGGVAFLCIDWRHAEVLMRVVRTLGLERLNVAVWARTKSGMGSLYRSQHALDPPCAVEVRA
jgi:hypothetical protein